ncbi:alpha-hydroxyketone-type quorum-sensing autoinducer synthase [Legionella maioricensis]|uniref:Quorum-sensing autoinducer CAI-1 synthase n=1 Tax=Legionella maioricensis TaxID=2896528 RepID=A0A9X2D354_9GAMM|nr:alpha-hydroxyketone-type quorum-sensing autoinducer synthase [Legionella maioricensis]MCL9685855.1 quorum-sensing autoinducer CAI-1 synthase [Legionella maioricensis]MCL9689274.1 quorum-sensing autoinducer CAI-1 synthase [Legionella maioricensis]
MVIQKYNKNAQDSLPETILASGFKRYPQFVSEALERYFEARVKNSWQGGHILHGKTPTSDALIFSSNDYLNISEHPQLIHAQVTAMQEFGNGSMQSGVFLSNNSMLFDESEKQFSHFLKRSSTLLTQSGWCANMGLIQALARPQVPVYLDFYTHMSFWTGVKASGATAVPFKHNSIGSLKKRLERHGPGIIAVDSIYSTIGTVSPLTEYVRLAQEYDCLLVVDESHSLGTHGPEGRGLVAQLGLSEQVDVITASLAKTFSGRGGLIAGKKELIEFVRYSSLPSIFSSALFPHDLAGFSSSIKIISQEEWRREQLHANANYLREALLIQGFDLSSSESQIIPIMAGTEANIIWLRNELEKENIFGAVFCAPATPKNKTLIRLSLSANHKKSDLNRVIECLSRLATQNPDNSLAFFHKGH